MKEWRKGYFRGLSRLKQGLGRLNHRLADSVPMDRITYSQMRALVSSIRTGTGLSQLSVHLSGLSDLLSQLSYR